MTADPVESALMRDQADAESLAARSMTRTVKFKQDTDTSELSYEAYADFGDEDGAFELYTDSATDDDDDIGEPKSRWARLVNVLKPILDARPSTGDSRPSSRASSPDQTRRRSTFDVGHFRQALHRLHTLDTSQRIEDMTIDTPPPVRRRFSFTLPRPGSSAADSRSTARRRFKDMLRRIRDLKMPKGLLRRNQETHIKPSECAVDRPSPFTLAMAPLQQILARETGPLPMIIGLVSLELRDVDHEPDSHVFHINLQYGDTRWSIRRTIVDFYKLHSQLTWRHLNHRDPPLPKFPSQLHYAFSRARALLPKQHDMISRQFLILRLKNKRRKALQNYLVELLSRYRYTLVQELFLFLEISRTVSDGLKGKEAMVKFGNRGLINAVRPELYLVVRDSYVACFDNVFSEHPRDVLMFDTYTRFERPASHFTLHKFYVMNETKKWKIRAETDRHFDEFKTDIRHFIETSEWTREHRFGSFAPVRQNAIAKFYIDGENYFSAIYDALMNAKSVIYIQDWWLSPEFYLKRPVSKHLASRLDHVLKHKAEQGVLVYVIIYKEVSFSLGIQSAYTKNVLLGLHRNIKVLRYPDHAPGGILYWALHDKCVIVDEDAAFYGGLDLCLGRWDSQSHYVGDYHQDSSREVWPGMDYSNPRIADFRNVDQFHMNSVDKGQTARMPWHDVGAMVRGQPARDIARNFCQRWNFIKSAKAINREDMPFLLPPSELLPDTQDRRGLQGTCEVQVLRSVSHWSMGLSAESSIHDAYVDLIRSARHYVYIENQFFISSTGQYANGSPISVRNRIAEAICERIIKAHQSEEMFRVFILVPLLPAFESDVDETNAATLRLIMHYHQKSISSGESSIFGVLRQAGIDPAEYITVCSLRNHGKLGQGPALNASPPSSSDSLPRPIVTEQVYIHSKVMIVDDEWAIIGSANINDRSMLGNRDSELATVIRDADCVPTVLGGMQITAGRFALELRLGLFAEHLGMDVDDELLRDIVAPDFWTFWHERAESNSLLYRNMFHCIPDDTVQTWEDYQRFVDSPFKTPSGHVCFMAPHDVIDDSLKRVQGNLVLYPTEFLKHENLTVVFPAREFVLPIGIFI